MHSSWFHLRRSSSFPSRWLSLMLVWAITVTLLPLHSRPAHAETFPITIAVPVFNSTNIRAWQLNQDAILVDNKLQLTSADTWQVGTAFYKNRASLANDRSFSAYFVMEFSDPGPSQNTPNGADGIVFTIQTQSNTAGSRGGGMGYEGITPSIGIEFDTWRNLEKGDGDDNHVGFNVGGSVRSLKVAPLPNGLHLEKNTWHAWVDYNGSMDQLEVRMSLADDRDTASLIMSKTQDLTNDVGQDVFIGFTAATGDAFEKHNITSMYFHNDYRPIDPRKHTYTHAPSKVELKASHSPIDNNGTDSTTITATVYAPDDTRVENQTVTFSTNLGTLSAATATTNAMGEASVTLTSSASGLATIRGTVAGGVYGQTLVTIQDVIPPVAPLITVPTDGSTLSNPRPPINGTAEPGSTVTVKEGDVTICIAVTDDVGRWSCTPTSDLSSGLHTITATATDAAGNTSPPTATTSFTIDMTAPALPLIHGPADGSRTDNQRPPINGTAEPGSTVTVKEGDVTICTAMSDDVGRWSCTPTSDLRFGLHTITATATDTVGNTSPPTATTTFLVFRTLIYIPTTGFFGYPDAPRMH